MIDFSEVIAVLQMPANLALLSKLDIYLAGTYGGDSSVCVRFWSHVFGKTNPMTHSNFEAFRQHISDAKQFLQLPDVSRSPKKVKTLIRCPTEWDPTAPTAPDSQTTRDSNAAASVTAVADHVGADALVYKPQPTPTPFLSSLKSVNQLRALSEPSEDGKVTALVLCDRTNLANLLRFYISPRFSQTKTVWSLVHAWSRGNLGNHRCATTRRPRAFGPLVAMEAAFGSLPRRGKVEGC